MSKSLAKMETTINHISVFKKHIALPQDHGSYVFIAFPLLIGLVAGGRVTWASFFLIVGVLAAFLSRQPLTIAVKVWSKRRPARDLPIARFWIIIYGLIGLFALTGLVWNGYAYLLILAIPGLPVFAWHLYLVSKRAERRQLGVELVATGVLALAAPAAFWVGKGYADPFGWLLWILLWFQSAASIVYAFMRLEQREQKQALPLDERLRSESQLTVRALGYASFNLAGVILLSLFHITPALLFIPYALQWAETIYGALRPATGAKPIVIGMQQLVVSSLFTVLFMLIW